MSSITLTATQRDTLLSLTQVTELFQTTNDRLNTGKKVNSANDDAVAYFRSQSLYNRATSLTDRKSTIDQNIQALDAAESATSAVEGLLNQLKGILDSARGSSIQERTAATSQFNNLGDQLAQLVKDASYQGLNILTSTSTTLATQFSERTAATFTINGYNLINSTGGNAHSLFTQSSAVFNGAGGFVFSAAVGDSKVGNGSSLAAFVGFSQLNLQASAGSTVAASSAEAVFTATETRLDNAIDQIQGITASLGTNVAILQARAAFTTDYSNALTTGGDNLTLADLNTEAANSQALQLRQQLGIQSLSIAGQQNQSILQLLK